MDEPLVRRLRWFIPAGLSAAFAIGWAVGPAIALQPPQPPLPAPVVGADDGMPAVLVSGRTYTAQFRITLPPDWPIEPGTDRGSLAAALLLGRGRGENDPASRPEDPSVIYCSGAYVNAAGKTYTLTCKIHAPDPGPFDLTLFVGNDGFGEVRMDPHGRPTVQGKEQTYHHTVASAP